MGAWFRWIKNVYENIYKKLEGVKAGIQGVGNTYFVDGNSGLDTNDGLTPDRPLKTITAALAKCTDNHDDYIRVIDGWNQDGGVISVNKNRVHIIGIGNKLSPYVMQKATGDAFIFSVTGDYCEIAGFALGGGATAGGIECVGSLGLWVHDCFFGDADIGDTPECGIECRQGTVNAYMVIENNIFAGSGGTSQGTISAYGIQAEGTNICRGTVIRKNIFGQLPTSAIRLTNMYGGFVLDNQIACDENAAGAAIIMSGSTGCLIDGNHANYGKTDMGLEPFVDTGSANCWGINYRGVTADLPA